MAAISVTNITKTEQYELNGTCRTVADAISKFTNGAGFRGTVKLNGVEVDDAGRAQPLRQNDVVMLLNPQAAGGDLKGAL